MKLRAVDNPEATIESILLWGQPCRTITPEDVAGALRPALIAWVSINQTIERDSIRALGTEQLLNVIQLGRSELPKAIDDLAGDGDIEPRELLRLALSLAPRFAPGDGSMRTDDLRILWKLESSLGALAEMGIASGLDESNPREFLGWSSNDGLNSIEVGEPIDQLWLGRSLEQLDLIRAHLQFDLVPRTLTIDGGVEATLEWLRADKAMGGGVAARWLSAHHRLLNHPVPTSDFIRAHLAPRSTTPKTESWGGFPKHTLAAALHLCGRTDVAAPAQKALEEAMGFAPLQVRRDLILARLLVLELLKSHEVEALPTERLN